MPCRSSSLVAAVDVHVLDVRVAQVGGERAQAVALVVDGLGEGLAVGGRGHQAAGPDLPLGPQPHRVADDGGRLGLADGVVQPARDLGQDLGDRAAQPRVGQRGLRPVPGNRAPRRGRRAGHGRVEVGHGRLPFCAGPY
ncbi:MAG TPA: hypothetical protein VK599_09675 [Streptosporangiaceae bacterium]|nr:hypothetical protein [Streptosporangiaceae bacterium]